MSENTFYQDPMDATGGSGDATDFRALVLQQMSRINQNGSQEMRGGYFEKVQKKEAMIVRYVPDSRKVLIESIKTFFDMLQCRFTEDDKESNVAQQYNHWKNLLTNIKDKQTKELIGKGEKEKELINQKQTAMLVEHYRQLYRILGGFCARQEYFGSTRGQS